MTTGCVEYWFLLHYKKVRPSIQTVAEKENGHWVLEHIEGLPTLEDNDIRNQWLYQSTLTFTTVQDALEFLSNL